LLELSARHQAVLHGEQRQQQQVDDERFGCRRLRAGVDGLWHHQAGYEADGIKNCTEKREIGDQSVQKTNESEYSITRYV
jgi:hypothetical protein